MWPKNLTDKFKVIIFDCDGVMFDSRKANIAFYNTILAYFEKPPLTADALEVVHMSTAEESINYLFRDDPHLQEAQKYRTQVDYKQFIPFMSMEPFLEEVLEGLKRKYQLAVATNRSNTIHPLLKTFKLDHFFDMVVSSLDVDNPKPHPESVFKIVNYFGIDAREAVYVGDSPVDRETALSAKVFFVAYKNSCLQADNNIDDLRELLSLIT
jgi:HAD superfamily hydrolase (TIGR01549 family)